MRIHTNFRNTIYTNHIDTAHAQDVSQKYVHRLYVSVPIMYTYESTKRCQLSELFL